MNTRRIVAGIGVCLVAGCASVPIYKPYNSYSGGYSDSPVSKDVHETLFVGRQWMNELQVKNYALLRCAEVTVHRGFEYFKILKAESSVKVRSETVAGETIETEQATLPDPVTRTASRTRHVQETPAQTVTEEIPQCRIVFQMLARDADGCLNAQQVIRDAQMKGILPLEQAGM